MKIKIILTPEEEHEFMKYATSMSEADLMIRESVAFNIKDLLDEAAIEVSKVQEIINSLQEVVMVLGYHDNDRCGFDLWSPVDTEHNGSGDANIYNEYHNACHGGEFYDRDEAGNIIPHNAVENRAFSPYAKHSQECEDIINKCIEQALQGNFNFSIEVSDDFSDEDVEYIEAEIVRRFGE